MISKAIGRYSKISPYKARLVASLIKGKDVELALGILTFSPKKAAVLMKKILKSAVANAEQKKGYEDMNLVVKSVRVDCGPMTKRIDPRAMGRAVRVRGRTSHITIELDSE